MNGRVVIFTPSGYDTNSPGWNEMELRVNERSGYSGAINP